jgi:hypothetical protein
MYQYFSLAEHTISHLPLLRPVRYLSIEISLSSRHNGLTSCIRLSASNVISLNHITKLEVAESFFQRCQLWDVEASTLSRQSAHRWRWGCQPYAPAAFYQQESSWYSLLLEAESTPGPSAAGRIRSIKKSDDLIRNRTRDLPACSIVSPTLSVTRLYNVQW